MLILLRRLDQIDRSKAARIDKADTPAVIGLQFQMLVQGDVVSPNRLEQHPPRHPKMQQDRPSRVQTHQDVFRAPAETDHACTGQHSSQTWGQGPAKIRTARDCPQQHPPFKTQSQPSHHGLDFGEFRHMTGSGYRTKP